MSALLQGSPRTGVSILSRVFEQDDVLLTKDAAESLLALRFAESDERRMNHLASKARKGTLTEKDELEAEQYNLVSHMLAFLQAKARGALQTPGARSVSP